MAYATRESFHGLTLDTKIARDPSPSTSHRHGDRLSRREHSIQGHHADEEESRVIDELHTATPPMLVPRSDNNSIESFESTLSYSHRPETFRRSFESFLRSDESQIEGKHKSLQQREDSRRYADDGEKTTFAKADPREYRGHRTIQRPRSSILCRVQTQDDDDDDDVVARENSNEQADEAEQHGGGLSFTSSKDDRTTSDINQPTSLTSMSTMSPLVEEVRTPYNRSPDGLHQNILFSPLSSPALAHRATSLEDPNMWSSSVPNSYTGKPRSYTIERHNSWRQIMRHQSSRRSTGSSGKSPASAFLSMWSAPEECAGPQPDDEGQMVGTDYVLGKQIGFGGFSTVKEAYKVEADGSTRRLAVKIVKKHVSGKDERENDQVQAEFDHEVRIWRQLNYHHILSLEAVYETDYATFCFTKLFIGGTLFDLVKANRRGLSMSLARKYSHQLASALRYLHEDMRIVHRDIKLENCLLDPERSEDGTEGAKLVLCDFGMAEWMTNDTSGEPLDTYDNPADRPPPQSIGPSGSSTSIAGSLEYASPELLLSSTGLIDPVVDIWAFGVVVYATLVGSRPFQHGFGPRLRSSIIEGDWNRDAILASHEDYPDRLEVLDLLCHCLDKDTSSRWTVRQVLNSEWFSSIAEPSDEHMDERSWRL